MFRLIRIELPQPRLIGERSHIVPSKALNMEDPNNINLPAVSEISFSSDDLEVLRRVEILGQPALPALALLPDLHA
jgi:hypothetical protein